MAMTIFLTINGLAVVFLLYALANFRKESRRPRNECRRFAPEFRRREMPEALVVSNPVSSSTHAGSSVIPFQARGRELGGKPHTGPAAHEAIEIRLRRISTK